MKNLQLLLGHSGRHAVAVTAVALLAGPIIASAQTEFSTASGTTTQNFDTLVTTTPTAGVPFVNDLTLANDPAAPPTLDGWSLYNYNLDPIGIYRAGNGSSNTGSFYSFGTTDDTDRSLGGAASGGAYFGSPLGGTVAGYMVFAATNTSASTFTEFTLGFDGEQWRNGGNASAQTMVLEYGIGASIAETTFTAPGGNFDWTSPVVGATPATGAPVNGNVEGLVANRGGQITGLNWQNGQTLFLRWVERNDAGNDHGLGIDKFSLSWAGQVIVPLYWDTNGAAAGIGGSGVWKEGAGSPANWNLLLDGTGAPQLADPAKRQIFGGTAGTVTIDAAGVSATIGLQFDVGGYTIAGGPLTLGPAVTTINTAAGLTTISAPIAGSNGLTKQGDGDLKLTATNTFAGTVAINGGSLILTSEAPLGAAANGVKIGGGTLRVDDTLTLGAAREITGAGTVRIVSGKRLTTLGRVNLGSVVLRSDSTDQSTGGTLALNGTDNTIGALSIVDPTQIEAPNGVTLSGPVMLGSTVATSKITGNVTLSGATQKFTVPDVATANIDFEITGTVSGVGRLQKTGAGTMRFGGGGDSFSGSAQLGVAGASPEEGGRLIISNKNGLGTDGTKQFFFNDGILETTTALTGANAVPVGLSIGAGQINGGTFQGGDIEFTGISSIFRAAQTNFQHHLILNNNVILTGAFNISSGTGTSNGLLLTGPGSLTIASATNTTDVPITVSGPTLVVNGALAATTSVNVTKGILMGSGTLAGFVAIGDGDSAAQDSVLSPGSGVGTLTTAGLTLASDATFRLELNSSLTTAIADQMISTAGVDLGAGIARLTISDLAATSKKLANGLEFTILDNTSTDATLGFFVGKADLSSFTVGANIFQIDYGVGTDANDIVLRVVPEPSSAALLALSAAALGWRRRRAR